METKGQNSWWNKVRYLQPWLKLQYKSSLWCRHCIPRPPQSSYQQPFFMIIPAMYFIQSQIWNEIPQILPIQSWANPIQSKQHRLEFKPKQKNRTLKTIASWLHHCGVPNSQFPKSNNRTKACWLNSINWRFVSISIRGHERILKATLIAPNRN